jgi:putative endonuclease
LVKFSKQDSGFDNKIKSTVEQQDNGGQLVPLQIQLMPMNYVYLLLSEKDGRFYTGSTNELKRRLYEHNSGNVISTRNRRPLKLIYYEGCLNEKDAKQREIYLKSGMGKKYLKNRNKNYMQDL